MEPIGMYSLEPTTAVVDSNGRLELIPLDILSSSVNLKTLWNAFTAPLAIVFREMNYDWYAVIPTDDTLLDWEIFDMPGKDHMTHRARQLAERGIQSDFGLEKARVVLGRVG